METLQNLVESYLESAGFNLIDTREGFIVADKLGFGGDRDTQLVWVTPPPRRVDNFDQLEKKLLREFETIIPVENF